MQISSSHPSPKKAIPLWYDYALPNERNPKSKLFIRIPLLFQFTIFSQKSDKNAAMEEFWERNNNFVQSAVNYEAEKVCLLLMFAEFYDLSLA